MRQLIHISRRWKYSTRLSFISQTCRHLQISPSLQNRKRRSQDYKNVPFTVREFEQTDRDGSRVEFDPFAGLKEEEGLLKAKIDRLEDELRVMREGPFGPNSEFMMSLPPQEREIALEALKEYDEKSPGDLESDAEDPDLEKLLEEDPEELIDLDAAGLEDYEEISAPETTPPKVQFRLKKDYHAYIRGLNNALAKVAGNEDNPETSSQLWKWYLRCRILIPGFVSQIEQEVWDTLWSSQLQVPECSKHLKLIAEDMLDHGKGLQDQQWLIFIDSLMALGLNSLGIERWHEARSTGSSDLRGSANFWRLGAQLYADSNQPLQAEKIAYEGIDTNQGKNVRALLPVISAWAKGSEPGQREKAWTCYLRVKTSLGSEMTMEDYDEISTNFLTAQKPDLALAVFKDMMLAREDSAYDSAALYKAAGGFIDEARTSSVNEKQVNSVSIAALTVLPKELQNKFFYGKWIKKLIGLGEVDAAGAVVELMYERGVRPDAKHLNGILGGWLRDEHTHTHQKAERMAWAMIEKRIEYVNLRRQMSYKQAEAALCKTPEGILIPSFVRRMVPRANIETFSVLLFHYVMHGMEDAVRQLTGHLSEAEIGPNAFVLNQCLLLFRSKQDVMAVWRYYTEMKNKVLPDLDTFACLWDTLKLHYDRSTVKRTHVFPHAREIFHEMRNWFKLLPHHSQSSVLSQFPHEMYEQIMRCFTSTRDICGTLLALHGLRRIFGCYPNEKVANMIVIQISRLAQSPKADRRRRGPRTRNLTTTQAGISRINKVMDEIESSRSTKLLENGADPEQLALEPLGEKRLDILTALLFRVRKMTAPQDYDIIGEMDDAAQAMGVDYPDISRLMRGDLSTD